MVAVFWWPQVTVISNVAQWSHFRMGFSEFGTVVQCTVVDELSAHSTSVLMRLLSSVFTALMANIVRLLCCRFERNIIVTVIDIAIPSVVILPTGPLHPNLQWPTPSGITEDEAREICQAPILLDVSIFSLCSNFTTQSLEVITDSCMLDLLVRKTFFLFAGQSVHEVI